MENLLKKDMIYMYDGFREKSFYLIVSVNNKKITTMKTDNKFINTTLRVSLRSEIECSDIRVIAKYDGSELSTFVSRNYPEYLI